MAKSVTKFTQTDDTLSVRFDYETVDPEYRAGLQEDAREIRARLKETALGMMDIGERLVRSRPKLPHGAWLPWLLSETGMSESWSRDCMTLYKRFHDQPLLLDDLDVALPPTAIVRLASAPDTAIEDVMDHLGEGGKLRVVDIEELVKRHRTHAKKEKDAIKERNPEPAAAADPVGADALRILADRARDELVPLVIDRMQQILAFLEDTEERHKAGHKVSLKDLQANLRERAQWLTDALEQITQRRAASDTKLVHVTFLDRPEHEPGPWASAAAFLRDLSASSAWEKIKAADVPELLRRGREALQAVLPVVPRSFFRTY